MVLNLGKNYFLQLEFQEIGYATQILDDISPAFAGK